MQALGEEGQTHKRFDPVQQVVPSTDQQVETRMHELIKGLQLNPSTTDLDWLYEELLDRFGAGSVSRREAELARHAADFTPSKCLLPNLVFFPEDAYQAPWLLRRIHSSGHGDIKVAVQGKGTSFASSSTPKSTQHPTVSMDLRKMRRILSYSRTDMTVHVEAGLDLLALNSVLQEDGLVFPVDVQGNATIGGMVGTDAEGISLCGSGKAVRMGEFVKGIKVAMVDGRVRELSRAMNPGLMHLFIGSGSSFGLLLEATLRLQPINKEPKKTIVVKFSRLEEASLAIPTLLHSQPSLTKCYLMDGCAIRYVAKQEHVMMPEYPSLILQIQGTETPFCMEGDPTVTGVEETVNPCEQEALWQSLSTTWFCNAEQDPSSASEVQPMVMHDLPPSCLPELIRELHCDGQPRAQCCIFGNAGAGSLVVISRELHEDAGKRAEIVKVVHRMGGSVAGWDKEHEDKDQKENDMWEAVKRALDPLAIFS